MSNPTLPLRLTQHGLDTPVLMLGDTDITRFVAADGLSIEYRGHEHFPVPTVTITFGVGALELDFDVDLLEHLLADAKARA